MRRCDIAIIGAGAAGLTAAIFAGQAAADSGRALRILLLDGAKKPGAKILASGGGRCNVTNRRVTPEDFQGGPRPIIRAVLRAFNEQRTVAWMESLGAPLKLEETGKYFPVSNNARTVLDALLSRAREVGAELMTGTRITSIERAGEGFRLSTAGERNFLECRRLIVATGGLSLPKSGSDGAGLVMLRGLGHSIVPVTPALAPLVLKPGPDIGGRFAEFAGITLEMRIGLYSSTGKRIHEYKESILFTHFGLSGPAALDFSRHWLRARLEHPEELFQVCLGHPMLPTPQDADRWLLAQAAENPRRTVAGVLQRILPERIARVFTESIGTPGSHDGGGPGGKEPGREPRRSGSSVDGASIALSQLPRAARLELARLLARWPVEVIGDRGYAFAETTAGGVDLREIDPATMMSKVCPNLHLCGELLDVDGRIGGFCFQWAWATGYLAGRACGSAFR